MLHNPKLFECWPTGHSKKISDLGHLGYQDTKVGVLDLYRQKTKSLQMEIKEQIGICDSRNRQQLILQHRMGVQMS